MKSVEKTGLKKKNETSFLPLYLQKNVE